MGIFYEDKPLLRGSKLNVNRKVLEDDFLLLDKRGLQFFVPKGYVTDGASIPESLEWAIGDPFAGVTEMAALVHDFECEYAAFCLDTRPDNDIIQYYPNYPLLKRQLGFGREYKSQAVVHRVFREIIEHEMKHNPDYGWIRSPWNLHNSKFWQYPRAKIMWTAVFVYNKFKHRNWK